MALVKSDIPLILNELTMEEKLSLLVGGQAFGTRPVERLGIPPMFMADGHNGVNLGQLFQRACIEILTSLPDVDSFEDIAPLFFSEISKIPAGSDREFMLKFYGHKITAEDLKGVSPEGRPLMEAFLAKAKEILPEGLPTCFPVGINMASSWDPELMRLIGQTVAEEARYYNVDVLLGPNINIHRDPRCGRVFESYSEDPHLTAKLAAAYVKGVQETGVMADVKHFACNNQETERRITDARVSERALREIYLPGFRDAVVDGGCRTVMPAYNKVNGTYCTENDFLLKDILRDEWDFDGLVISDWGAVYDKTAALLAGNDLEMPGPTDRKELAEALENGSLAVEDIDRALVKILEAIADSNGNNGKNGIPYDRERSRSVARKAAADSMILLKNNGLFPLTDQPVAVMGQNAVESWPTGKGSAGVITDRLITIKDGLEQRFPVVLDGSSYAEMKDADKDDLIDRSEVFLFCIGELWGEGSDRPTVKIAPEAEALLQEAVPRIRSRHKKIALLLNVPGPVELGSWADEADAVLCMYYPGGEMGSALADILSGDVNPSGKLTLTWPRKIEDVPAYLSLPGSFRHSVYGEDIFVGYRYYDTKKINPLYPFGHGLSYSEFRYSDLKMSIGSFSPEKDKHLRISFTLANVGDRPGREVAQLYLSDLQSALPRPEKELKGFRKIALDAGESTRVEFLLEKEDFAFYDSDLGQWVVEPGQFKVRIGSSARDIRLEGDFTVDCTNPYPPNLNTPIIRIFADEKVMSMLNRHLGHGWGNHYMIQQELVYHQELPLEQCLRTHLRPMMPLTDEEFDGLLKQIAEEFRQL